MSRRRKGRRADRVGTDSLAAPAGGRADTLQAALNELAEVDTLSAEIAHRIEVDFLRSLEATESEAEKALFRVEAFVHFLRVSESWVGSETSLDRLEFSEPRTPVRRHVEPVAGKLARVACRLVPSWCVERFGPELYDYFVELAENDPGKAWWLRLAREAFSFVGHFAFSRFHRCRIREGASNGGHGSPSHED